MFTSFGSSILQVCIVLPTMNQVLISTELTQRRWGFLIYFFICCLFNDAVSSDYAASNDGMIIMNWKGYGRKRSWANWRFCPGIYLEGPRATTRKPQSGQSSPGRVFTTDLPITKQVITTRPRRLARVIIKKLTVVQPVKKIPAFYGTQIFITVLTTSPPMVPTLSQVYTVRSLPTWFSEIVYTSRFSKWSLSFKFSDHNFEWISHLCDACYMLRPPRPSKSRTQRNIS
jgi:hypothetical protein